MADERSKYLRKLRRRERSARRWTVLAASLGGAATVLVPYHGLGLPDAFWAASAGGAAALAAFRWADARVLAARPAPPPLEPALAAARARQRLEGALSLLPAGRMIAGEVERQRVRARLRGSAAAPYGVRLERASAALDGLSPRLGGPAESAVGEAALAEASLRDLAERAAAVERALRLAPDEAQLVHAHAALIGQLADGVAGYERLVAAAAGYVAADGDASGSGPAVLRLREAADLLAGIAAGLTELRAAGTAR